MPSPESTAVVGHRIEVVHRRRCFVLRTNHVPTQILSICRSENRKKERSDVNC